MMFTRLAYLLFLTLLSLKLQGQTALVLLGFVFSTLPCWFTWPSAI